MTEYGASIAFHKQIDREGRHFILQDLTRFLIDVVLILRRFDLIANGGMGRGFDINIPSNFFHKMDLSMGIGMSPWVQTSHRFWNDNGLAINLSLHHINRPRETSLNSENRIGLRPMVTLQGSIQGSYRFTIHPLCSLLHKRTLEIRRRH